MFTIIYDLKRFFMNYKQIIFIIAFSLGLSLFAGTAGAKLMYSDMLIEPFSVGIVDNDNSYETNLLYTNLQDMPSLKDYVKFIKLDEGKAKQMLINGEIAAYAVMPESFAMDIKQGVNSPLTVVSGNGLKASFIKLFINCNVEILSATQGSVYVVLDNAALQNGNSLYDKAFWDINLQFLSLYSARARMLSNTVVSATDKMPPLLYFTANIFIFFCMLNIAFVSNCFIVNNEKVLSKLSITGIPKIMPIISSTISGFIMHIFLCLTVIIPIILINEVKIYNYINILSFILFTFCLSAFSVLLSLITFENRIKGLIVFVFSFISLFVSGGIVPLSFLPGIFAVLKKFTLNGYAIAMVQNFVVKFGYVNFLPPLVLIFAVVMLLSFCLHLRR